MTRYQNGSIPLSALIQLDSGDKHWTTPHTARAWYQLRSNVQRKYGVTLHITPGWNAYRPYDEQVAGRKSACAQGNCLAAADPGTSSHGGTWWDWRVGKTVDSMALDIGDWWQLKQATFYAECRAVGLEPGLITKAVAGRTEEWHVIDLAPYDVVPASTDSHPLETPTSPAPREEEDEDMAMHGAVYKRKADGANVFLLFNEVSGFYVEHIGVDASYNNPLAQNWGTGSWPTITEAHAVVIKRSLDAVRRTAVTGALTVDLGQ